MEFSLQHLPADVLGLSEVARHALAGRPHPAGFAGLTIPDRIEAIPRPPEALDPDRRPQLVEALEGPLAALEPHVAVLESVRSLAEPGAAVVIAGQQPGFLGGPLYNVWKALHVVRLARALSDAWNRPVVPAFWVHGDDHDVAEVHHLWIQNPNLDLTKVGLAGISSGRVPMSRLRFDAEKHRLGPIRELLRQNLVGGQPLEDELEASLPRDGETFARAFTRQLLARFGSLGLVPIEPDWIRPQLSRTLANLLGADFGAALEDRERSSVSAAG